MDINRKLLENPWTLIEEMADEETKEEFELDDILVDISLKIINYRIDQEITQKQLAEKLKVSQAMISKLESGEYNPTIGQLWKISKKLGWTFEVLMKERVEAQVWNTDNAKIESGNEEMSDEGIIDQIAEGA
ncbi:helix-turn-helix domain protein [Alkaliphilus metalliredigens QYMF]|uniref:Helix-turn-helix domain protein n=1 Tax=Alkaliphilus metalliredigens (strain QYMF) TaxID=293826 RepID=A6TSV4_ALKMQ|nr:helix-turn-helix transcriptional regulator [Alkaliphilus metalliredigens]ABR49272.1 helix-turn-helix domain protein [Alkaliphilus metalliredigens QYMF]